jgi:hypothetical protein
MIGIGKEQIRRWLKGWLSGWKAVNELKEGWRREKMYENPQRGLPNELIGHEWVGPLSIETLQLISSAPKSSG